MLAAHLPAALELGVTCLRLRKGPGQQLDSHGSNFDHIRYEMAQQVLNTVLERGG
jgi:hypothetical protein